MSNYVVGITGPKRSGKDTFAARLIHNGFTRVAFADPLKAVAEDLDPAIVIEADELGLIYGPGAHHLSGQSFQTARLSMVLKAIGWEKAKEIREVRRTLQALGVAVRDHVGDLTWVEAAVRRVNEIPGPVVITDVRFPNESRFLDTLVRISRPGLELTDTHVSETAMADVVADIEIVNDGTVEDLQVKADLFTMTHLIAA